MNIYINKKNDTFVSFSGMKESNSIKVAGIVYKVTEGKNQRGIYFPVALLAKGDDGEYTLTDKEIDLEKYLREVDFDFKEIHKKYSANRILADLILSQKKVQKKYRWAKDPERRARLWQEFSLDRIFNLTKAF